MEEENIGRAQIPSVRVRPGSIINDIANNNTTIGQTNVIRGGTTVIGEDTFILGGTYLQPRKLTYYLNNEPSNISLPPDRGYYNVFVPDPIDKFVITDIVRDTNNEIIKHREIELTTGNIIDLVETVKQQETQIKELLDFKQEALACVLEYNAKISWNKHINNMEEK